MSVSLLTTTENFDKSFRTYQNAALLKIAMLVSILIDEKKFIDYWQAADVGLPEPSVQGFPCSR